MKTVKVQYRVKPGFAETNKANISKVMQELRELNDDGIKYSAFTCGDGQTFIHLAMFSDESGQQKLNGLDSFKNFQAALKESEPVEPPKPELLELVDSTYEIF
ncbi:MAG: hypothetical protein IAE90_15345 [Ignavibacteria bacterium]|nr:hypothetical protein [Ignavibacteria bacterium]